MSDTPLLALRYPNRRMAARLAEVWDAGAAALPVSPAMPEPEVRGLLDRLRPAAIEDDRGTTELADAVPVPEETALVVPTSGSSGDPKGVQLSHAALEASARAYAARLGTAPGERWLCCLPLSHIGGLGILVRSRLAGTTPVILDRFDVEAVAADREATLISLVPTTLLRLLDAGADLSRYSAVLVGGAGLAPEQRRRALEGGVRLVGTYGMTETCGGCNFDGVPLDGVEMTVVEEQIFVKGPMLMDGYRLQPGLTSRAVKDGWFATSDRGRIGPDGRLEVLGRMDDVIVTGGEKVDPSEVEAVLRTHPGIADAAVAGVPDAQWGQAVAALVVPAGAGPPPGPAEVSSFLAASLASFKAPKRVVAAERIPRTASGKVRRPAVRRLLEASDGGA